MSVCNRLRQLIGTVGDVMEQDLKHEALSKYWKN
jgi:hypothetical protein